jgi:hypothetical protein
VKDTTDDGTGCITYSDRAILFWQGGTCKKTVEVDQQNVFTFALPSGYTKFHAMCVTCHIDPWKEEDEPGTVEQTDLVCQLIHPERDDPENKDPELISKVQRFYPNNVSRKKDDCTETEVTQAGVKEIQVQEPANSKGRTDVLNEEPDNLFDLNGGDEANDPVTEENL